MMIFSEPCSRGPSTVPTEKLVPGVCTRQQLASAHAQLKLAVNDPELE